MRSISFVVFILSARFEVAWSREPPALRKGEVLFEADFEGKQAFAGWAGPAKAGPGHQSEQSLFIARPADSPVGSTIVQIRLPAERVRGYVLHFSGMVKAESVTEKPKPWNGVKFMVPIVGDSGRQWPQGTIDIGDFDWKRVVFPVRVPKDATQVSLYLGLEAVTGKVWFDDLKVTVRKEPFVPHPRKTTGPVYKGHKLPRLRGAMISPNVCL